MLMPLLHLINSCYLIIAHESEKGRDVIPVYGIPMHKAEMT
jgi:hypothetical protein